MIIDDITTLTIVEDAVTIDGAPNKFRAEGETFVLWRGDVWDYCYQELWYKRIANRRRNYFRTTNTSNINILNKGSKK